MIEFDKLNIGPLDRTYDRGAFCCGKTPIDNYVKNNIRKEHEAYNVRVFVASYIDSTEILGLYALTIKSVDPQKVSAEAQKQFGRVESVPTIYLSCIAVNQAVQGKGIGYFLMMNALNRALEISENAGVFAVTLEAIDEEVAKKYEGYGFERFIDGELDMFMPLKTIRDAAMATNDASHSVG